MTQDISKRYTHVDTTIGTRLLLGFVVSPLALQQRLRPPWQISSQPNAYISSFSSSSSDLSKQIQHNLYVFASECSSVIQR